MSTPVAPPETLKHGSSGDWRLQIPESRRRPLRIWLWSIAAMTLAVLVVGGVTRLTQSGLSIVDWQPIVGAIPPLNEQQWSEAFDRYRQFPEYQRLRRGMTLGEFKVIFFWEYLHRLVARLIGLVFAVPFVVFWLRGYLNRPLLWRTLGLFGLGAMQGVLGWLMVRSGLVDRPSVSHFRLAAHLSLAFLIFGSCVWLARDLTIDARRVGVSADVRRRLSSGLAVTGILLAAQIVWGAFVAGLDAGLVFNTFPLMAGRLVPPGLLALDPLMLNFVQNAVAVQWAHRVLGTVLLAAAMGFYFLVPRQGADARSRHLAAVLMALIATQYLLGVLTLVYVVPVGLAVAHQVAALAIFGVWVAWVHHVRHLSVPARMV
jgi:cytochrome c oxidase assembly protein subunit 15